MLCAVFDLVTMDLLKIPPFEDYICELAEIRGKAN